MKFDRQLRPATETSWVISNGGKTIPRWRTAAIWKSIHCHISVKNHLIFMKFCTQQQILNWIYVTWSKIKKLHWTDSEFDRTYFLLVNKRIIIMLPPVGKGPISVAFVRLSVCPSVAYIATNSRTQRPSVPQFGSKVPHLLDATRIPVSRSKVKGQGHQAH